MKKIFLFILLAITILSFSSIKAQALELPSSAYNVPWDVNEKYIILQPRHRDTIIAQLYTGSIQYGLHSANANTIMFEDVGNSYYLDNGNWKPYNLQTVRTVTYNNIDYKYISMYQNVSSNDIVLYKIHYINETIENYHGDIVFTQRPFLSQSIIRERATTEAIMEMENSMSKDFGTILQIGLVILFLILLPMLLVRLVKPFLA